MKIKVNSHVKIGDKVKVISGKQKGFIGVITSLVNKKSVVFLDGVTPRIRFMKAPQGGDAKRVEIQIPIHVSNVMLWDKDANLASKIGYKVVNDQKIRYFKKSGNLLQEK
jgi:large subunit ribosomal protein L24